MRVPLIDLVYPRVSPNMDGIVQLLQRMEKMHQDFGGTHWLNGGPELERANSTASK